jgi:hypothetical protein
MEQEKKRPLRKIFKVIGKIGRGIVRGVVDTALPNVKDTIKMSEPDIPNEKKKVEIDFVRLITAVTVWVLLLLVFFGKIKFEDILDLITRLLIK